MTFPVRAANRAILPVLCRDPKWDLFERRDPLAAGEVVPIEIADCRSLVYTPPVTNTPRAVRSSLHDGLILLRGLVGRARGPAHAGGQPDFTTRCELVIVDEADRLNTPSLEELRDFYDRGEIGLCWSGCRGWRSGWPAIRSSTHGSASRTPSGR